MKVKILCLNLLWGGKFMDRILDFIRSHDPDLVLLQEAYESENPIEPKFNSVAYLRSQMPSYQHSDFAGEFYHNTHEGRHLMGNAIISKYPIKTFEPIYFDERVQDVFEDRPETLPMWPRNIQHAEVVIDGVYLNLFNTHGVWGEDGYDNQRRLAMSEKIIQAVKGKENVILAGDTNVDEHTTTIKNIEKYLVNIFKGERKTSFNMRQKPTGGYATAVVDFIFVSPSIKVISHESPDVDISDHLPMLAELEI